MNEKGFSDLIRRYQSGTCTDREKDLIDKWLESRHESKQASALTAEERNAMLADVSNSLLEKITSENKTRSIFPPSGGLRGAWLRAAAAITLLAASSYFIWQFASTGSFTGVEMLHASSSGTEVSKVILADGSIIWLKGNSTLTYPHKFTRNERNVILTGEALFEVAKDPGHPFIIACGNLTAEVLGTSLNIRATEEKIEVLVLTGKVSLATATTNQKIIVLPNEKALFNKADEQLAKIEAPEDEPVEVVKRTEYSMSFSDTRMDEFIRRMEAKFNVSISVENESLNNCLVTADLTDQSLTSSLDKITKVLSVKYEVNGKEILLAGKGCN